MTEKGDELLSFFKEKGSKSFLSSKSPISLGKKDTVFAVEAKDLYLFILDPNKKRHFLCSCQLPIFFGYEPTDIYELLIFAKQETVCYELPASSFKEFSTPQFIQAFDSWIEILYPSFAKSFLEEKKERVVPNQTLPLSSDQIYVLKGEAKNLWMRLKEGEVFIFDDANLALSSQNPFFPIGPQIWVKASRQSSKIEILDTAALLQQNLWMQAIQNFYKVFFHIIASKIEEQEKKEKILLEERISERKHNLKATLSQIEAIFVSPHAKLLKPRQDPLEDACQWIGREMQLDFLFPKEEYKNTEERLNAICASSQIHKRKVKLRGKWWKEAECHLLGFLKKEERPVALLRKGQNYTMIDGSKKVHVDASLDSLFSRNAYVFYASVPPEIKKSNQIFRLLTHRYTAILGFIALFSVIASLIAFAFPITTKLLFLYAIPQNNSNLLLYLTIGLLGASLGFFFFSFIRNHYFLKLQSLASAFAWASLWDRLLKLSPQFFRRFSAGNLVWRLFSIEKTRMLLSANNTTFLLSGIFSFFYLLIMAFYSPLLTLLVFLIAIFSLLMLIPLSYFKIKILSKSLEIQSSIQGFLIQVIRGIAKLRTAGAESDAFSHWLSLFSHDKALQTKVQYLQNGATTLSAFFPIFTMAVVYGVLVTMAPLSLSSFLAFNIALGSFLSSLYPSYQILIQIVSALPLWKRTEIIFQETLEETKEKTDPGKLSGALFVDSVTFGYDPASPPVIRNLSFSIKPEQMVGIVGPSGSGKSTLIRLLLGFEKPQSGEIYYDGKALAHLDPRKVRKQIGTVLQGEIIRMGSIHSNLCTGGTYSSEQIKKALELSGFAEDLKALPMGLFTYIPMDGETLSGGQKQKLLLTKALLANPSFLIFDEATSALDNRMQEELFQNIAALNVTRIIIAHRLSTLKNVDWIYVIEKGEIVQQGTFETLSNTSELFSQMVHRQSLLPK